jgi:catechol 2,3-dioxygenase
MEMPINLERIGHCAVRVRDVERAKKFYIDVLGFQFMEQDPDHGGVFMSLPGDGHTIDVSPVEDPDNAPGPVQGSDRVGVAHIAFKVGNYEALKEAYDTLVANGVEVRRMIDHVSQRSIYFSDPDGNGLEIYYEYPTARKLFLESRGDEDFPFTFDDPLPEWAGVKG